MADRYNRIQEIDKFNPYHDARGRFASADNASSFTIRTRAGYQQGQANRAISREKERHSKESQKKPKAMTLDEYLGSKGLSFPISDFMDDKLRNPHGLTARQRKQLERDADKARNEYADKRNKAIQEYNEKVKNGEIRPKTNVERLIRAAHGHEDNESVQAARRALARRGIDWKTAKVDKSIDTIVEIGKFNPYHDAKGRFATSSSHTLFTVRTKDPKKQHWADMAIAREKDKHSSGKQNYLPEQKKPKAQKPKEKPPEKKPAKQPQAESDFKPAKTKKEAIKYAQEQLGFQKVSYGTKIDIDTVNHINKQITDIQAKYPEVKGAVQTLKTTTRQNVYAQVRYNVDGTMNLEIGSGLYGRGIEWINHSYDRDLKSGFHPAGTTAGGIIWHEYGHVLGAVSAKQKLGVGASEKVTNLRGGDVAKYVLDRRGKSTEKEWVQNAAKSLGVNTSDVASGISRYATKNAAETFAEAFAEVTGSANPRKESVAVVKASGWYRE